MPCVCDFLFSSISSALQNQVGKLCQQPLHLWFQGHKDGVWILHLGACPSCLESVLHWPFLKPTRAAPSLCFLPPPPGPQLLWTSLPVLCVCLSRELAIS